MLGPSHIIKRLGMTFVICRDSEAIRLQHPICSRVTFLNLRLRSKIPAWSSACLSIARTAEFELTASRCGSWGTGGLDYSGKVRTTYNIRTFRTWVVLVLIVSKVRLFKTQTEQSSWVLPGRASLLQIAIMRRGLPKHTKRSPFLTLRPCWDHSEKQ